MYFFFYYPIGAETDDEGLPWLTGLLTALMLGIFVFLKLFPSLYMATWTWWVYLPGGGLSPGLFLSTLNHAGWMHLIGNLLYLWAFGPSLERVMGPARYFLAVLILGLAGNLCQGAFALLLQPDLAGYGIVGASGAISGLLGLFLLRFPYGRIRTVWVIFSPLHGMAKSGLIRIPSVLAILSWVAFQVLAVSSRVLGGGQDMTAYGAHFGGLAAGLLLGFGLHMNRDGQRFHRRHAAQQCFSRGDFFGAYEAIMPLLDSTDPEDLTLAARASRLIGHEAQTLALYRRVIELALGQGDEAGAAATYAEALRFYPRLLFDEGCQCRLIKALDGLGLENAALQAIELFRCVYKTSPQLGVLLLRAARMEEGIDPDSARRYYREHLERFPGSPYEALAQEALRQLSKA